MSYPFNKHQADHPDAKRTKSVCNRWIFRTFPVVKLGWVPEDSSARSPVMTKRCRSKKGRNGGTKHIGKLWCVYVYIYIYTNYPLSLCISVYIYIYIKYLFSLHICMNINDQIS